MPYWKLFNRLIVRPLRREPVRTLLAAFAVALGVAVVVGIELAGNAAVGSFRSSLDTLADDADLEITATGGLPADVLAQLTALPHSFRFEPRMEDFAFLPARNRTVPWIGVDFIANAPEQDASPGDSDPADRFRKEQVWVSAGLGYKSGDRIWVLIGDTLSVFIVGGVLSKQPGEVLAADLSLTDHLFRRQGKLDRILVHIPSGRSIAEWEKLLRSALPPGAGVEREGSRTDENRRMLAAFRWNLRVLSYIALIVGAFLIYNTISVSVVRRRAEIGILRALGATRTAVLLGFVGEAACFGLAGALAGIALGRVLAASAIGLIASTVQSLYVSSTPASVELSWEVALLGIGMGIGVAVLSALSPAWEASRAAPLEAMARGRGEHRVQIRKLRGLLAAGLLAAGAWIASMQGAVDGKPLFGYLAALLLIAASAFAIPALVSVLAASAAAWMRRLFGVEALLAARGLAGSLRRTSVLVGALSTAIAMMAAVGIMVGSFRQTVVLWMEDRLQADLYLRPATPGGADRHPVLSPEVADRIAALPEVAAVDRFRAYSIRYGGMPATLGAGDARIAGRYGRRAFLSGAKPQEVFEQLTSTDSVIISEPFANKHGVKAGDILSLPIAGQPVRLRVLDVYYDYSSERGYILMDRSRLLKYLPDPAPSNIAVYLRRDVPLERGRDAIEPVLKGRKVVVLSNRSLREEALRVFDRTFAITYALEAVAVLIAVMGVAGALLALVIDRRREFGLVRFLGGAQAQVRRIILFEAALLGLFANAVGILLGFFLSLLLIFVINKQSFGWTIQFHWPVSVLTGALSLVYLATVTAALYPARVAAQLNPIEVVHEE
ncbi:MAG: ABC transporter permease [Bryobacteraceae bacterium]|nr:ABC transporter permease [Bryobacterales bacterium]NUN01452.1 ABC transporter permease [Bryobacteraceae bacterium]